MNQRTGPSGQRLDRSLRREVQVTGTGILMFTRGLQGPSEASSIAAELETAGVTHVFISEAGNDAMTTAAAMALATRTATIGTGIANIYIRHPYELAMAAAGVDDLSAGRFVLGIGTAHQITNVSGLGLDMTRALSRMRDYLAALNGALEAGRTSPDVTTDRYRIVGPRVAWNTNRRIPIVLGAVGDRMLRLAARSADGVILSLATLDQIRRARTLLDMTAEQAGRNPDEIRIYAVVNTCLLPTRREARSILRQSLTGYFSLPFYERSLHRGGIEVIDGRVPDGAVDRLALAGPPEWARAHLEEFRGAGVDIPLLAPTWSTPDTRAEYLALADLAT